MTAVLLAAANVEWTIGLGGGAQRAQGPRSRRTVGPVFQPLGDCRGGALVAEPAQDFHCLPADRTALGRVQKADQRRRVLAGGPGSGGAEGRDTRGIVLFREVVVEDLGHLVAAALERLDRGQLLEGPETPGPVPGHRAQLGQRGLQPGLGPFGAFGRCGGRKSVRNEWHCRRAVWPRNSLRAGQL
jgi:hypothetical protein